MTEGRIGVSDRRKSVQIVPDLVLLQSSAVLLLRVVSSFELVDIGIRVGYLQGARDFSLSSGVQQHQ
jgi:hypothetical protein